MAGSSTRRGIRVSPHNDTRAHVVCTVVGHRFALPLAAVEEVHRAVAVVPLPGAPPAVIGAVDVRGQVLPVLDLRRRLGLPAGDVAVTDRLLQVWLRGHRVLLLVDGVTGVVELDVPLSPQRELIPGVTHLGTLAADVGGPLVVHDVDAFLDASEVVDLTEALRRLDASTAAR